MKDLVNLNLLRHLDKRSKNPELDQADMKPKKETKLNENKNSTKKNLKENEKKNFSTWRNRLDFKKKSSKLAKFYKDHPQQIKTQSLSTLPRRSIFKENRLLNLNGRSKSSIEIETELQGLTSQTLSSRV